MPRKVKEPPRWKVGDSAWYVPGEYPRRGSPRAVVISAVGRIYATFGDGKWQKRRFNMATGSEQVDVGSAGSVWPSEAEWAARQAALDAYSKLERRMRYGPLHIAVKAEDIEEARRLLRLDE